MNLTFPRAVAAASPRSFDFRGSCAFVFNASARPTQSTRPRGSNVTHSRPLDSGNAISLALKISLGIADQDAGYDSYSMPPNQMRQTAERITTE